MGQLRPPGERVGVDAEVVVLAGDLDVTRAQVAHRVVAAVVAERELEGLPAEGAAEELVPEADAEDRHLADEAADRLDRVGHHRRIAGSVGEEHPVRAAGQHLGRGRRGGDDLHLPERRRAGAGSRS